MKNLKEEYDEHQCWGMVAALDLYHCHPPFLKQRSKIKKLIIGLCRAIKMKRFGPPLVARFAEGALEGFSAIQFIETSSVTLHFDETENRAFIDIFSCKYFDPRRAENFCRKFLRAKRSRRRHYFRY